MQEVHSVPVHLAHNQTKRWELGVWSWFKSLEWDQRRANIIFLYFFSYGHVKIDTLINILQSFLPALQVPEAEVWPEACCSPGLCHGLLVTLKGHMDTMKGARLATSGKLHPLQWHTDWGPGAGESV